MPKVVDHDERRAEIARALWRVVARNGIEGASVRSVAAEAGWSAGAVRHYFTTQDELLHFAATQMAGSVRTRVVAALAAGRPGPARVARVLEELLPLDEVRLGEVRVWLAVLLRSARDDRLDSVRLLAWQAERHLCRIAVRELSSRPRPEAGVLLPAPEERLAVQLHLFVDGLTLQAATVPEQLAPPVVRSLLRAYLTGVRTSLP